MGERVSKERRRDKAQVERREGEKLYVDTKLAEWGEKKGKSGDVWGEGGGVD